jgi:hypothetical protein
MNLLRSEFRSLPAILSSILIISISNIPTGFAVTDVTSEVVTVQIPGSYTLNKVIHDPKEFALLGTSTTKYQFVNRGQLLTFSPTLNFESALNITQPGGAWATSKDGSLLGPAGCKSLTLGIDSCEKIIDIETGISETPSGLIDGLDTHEFVIDKDGNYWVLSYPIYSCKTDGSSICKKYKVDEKKLFADCLVNKIDKTGKTLYSWKASENIPQTATISAYRSELNRGNYVDLFHCNSIDVDSSNGILLSARNLNSLYYIDIATSKVLWKLSGRYQSGIAVSTNDFKDKVGSESIAQHDARSLGNGYFSYFDNKTHSSKPARGVIFKVTKSTGRTKAQMITEFVNPNGNNSMCTGSMRKSDLGNYVVGWGCNLDLMTIFTSAGKPIVTLSVIKTPETNSLFQSKPLIFNHVDWGPAFDYGITYRVLPKLAATGS